MDPAVPSIRKCLGYNSGLQSCLLRRQLDPYMQLRFLTNKNVEWDIVGVKYVYVYVYIYIYIVHIEGGAPEN